MNIPTNTSGSPPRSEKKIECPSAPKKPLDTREIDINVNQESLLGVSEVVRQLFRTTNV